MPIRPATRVLQLLPGIGNPRNSEGDFIQLSDGRWLLIYSHFEDGAGDHAAAHLAARVSTDEGRTWSQEDVVVLPNEGAMNVMSVSLLRLRDQRIAMFYLRKDSMSECRPRMRTSSDETATWEPPVDVIPESEPGYYVVNNDRVLQLGSGRLIVPASLHTAPPDDTANSSDGCGFTAYGRIFCYMSDDAGATWRQGRQAQVQVQADCGEEGVMVQEPGLIERNDGSLMMFCRTDAGCQYIAYSEDAGESWGPLHASDIVSPRSPASMARIPDSQDLLMVWNNHAAVAEALVGKRTPLTVAVSRDEGETWVDVRNIEINPFGWYCYTAIAFAGEHVLLGYCAGDTRDDLGLATLQVTRVPLAWLHRGG